MFDFRPFTKEILFSFNVSEYKTYRGSFVIKSVRICFRPEGIQEIYDKQIKLIEVALRSQIPASFV